MTTVVALAALAVAFVLFALLGPAERGRACDHARPGDPKCERCPLDAAKAEMDDAEPDP